MTSGAYSNLARPVLCPIVVRYRIGYCGALSHPVWRYGQPDSRTYHHEGFRVAS